MIHRSQTKVSDKTEIESYIKVRRKEKKYHQTHKKHHMNTPAYPYLKTARLKDMLTCKNMQRTSSQTTMIEYKENIPITINTWTNWIRNKTSTK